jgi:hypothetical protein
VDVQIETDTDIDYEELIDHEQRLLELREQNRLLEEAL